MGTLLISTHWRPSISFKRSWTMWNRFRAVATCISNEEMIQNCCLVLSGTLVTPLIEAWAKRVISSMSNPLAIFLIGLRKSQSSLNSSGPSESSGDSSIRRLSMNRHSTVTLTNLSRTSAGHLVTMIGDGGVKQILISKKNASNRSFT